MKIIFLDFDGVLNSHQEVVYHHRIRKNRPFLIRLYSRLGEKLCMLLYKIPKLQRMSIYFSLFYFTDHCDFDPIACSNIQYMLDESPETYIVVSSTWRTWGIKWLKKILKRNGINPYRVLDVTGREPGQRGVQCKAWLDRYNGLKHTVSTVTHFVAIDDDGDFDVIKDNLVQTDNLNGFVYSDLVRAMKLLGHPRFQGSAETA